MLQDAKFTLDAPLDVKAIEVTKESGDLIIEGLAADIGMDRQGEAFAPEVFQKAIQKFLSGNAPLLYHHDPSKQLGQVIELEPRSDALYFKAIVPKPPETDWSAHIYTMLERGMMKGVSVGGQFHRDPAARKIVDADFMEISMTPLPVNPRTLATVAKKAFEGIGDAPVSRRELQAAREHLERRIREAKATLDGIAARIGAGETTGV